MVIEAPPSHSPLDEAAEPRPTPRRAAPALLVIAALVLLAASVGAWALARRAGEERRPPQNDPTAPSPSAPTSGSASQTLTSIYEAEQAAIARIRSDYELAVRAGDLAAEQADPSEGELERRLTGDALASARRYLAMLRGSGVVVRGADRDQLRVFTVKALDPTPDAPTRAVVLTCWVSWAEQYDADDGRLLSDGQPGVDGAQEILVLEEGTWKLAEITERTEPCVGVSP